MRDPSFESLLTPTHLPRWRASTFRDSASSGCGSFVVGAERIEAHAGNRSRLLWLAHPTPPRYVLRLQWMMTATDDNSGVFVAFPNPEAEGYGDSARAAIDLGFEVQIDELARPDRAPVHRTAAIYAFKGPTDGPLLVHEPGNWNDYAIAVDPPDFTVAVNGVVVNRFHFAGDPCSPRRARTSTPQEPRFIGLQSHTGTVVFRAIEWKAL